MNLVFNENDLRKYRDDAEIIADTARQIMKDFALFGIHIDFPTDIKLAYQELFNQLEYQISVLLNSNNSKILSLLYQIDIPETQIRQKAELEPEKVLSEVVSELILERELKKVLTRLYFKQNGY